MAIVWLFTSMLSELKVWRGYEKTRIEMPKINLEHPSVTSGFQIPMLRHYNGR